MIFMYIYGFLLGFIIAITGAWKDTLFEKFNLLKFFRSPLVTEFWYLILLFSLPNESLVLILLSSATLERFSTEIYKAIRRQPPGKFKRQHKDSGWIFERINLRYVAYIFLIIGILIFLDQFRLHHSFFEIEEINNHETIGLIFLALSLPTYLWAKFKEVSADSSHN